VISGVFRIGLDDDFDASKLKFARSGDRSPRMHVSFPLGKIRRMHTQVNAIGPLGLDYVSAQDDPRNRKLSNGFPTRAIRASRLRWLRGL